MPPLIEAGPLQADLLQKGGEENALSLLLTSENLLGRYRITNFLPTYFICVVTEQSLGTYLVVAAQGSALWHHSSWLQVH